MNQPQPQMPWGAYVDKILEQANSTFATLYRKVFKQYWHDGKFTAHMAQNYTSTDWKNGFFETYIPTRDSTHGLSYYRIAIKLVDSINNEDFHKQVEEMRHPTHAPVGTLDSELIIVISQRLNRWGFIRSYNYTPQKTRGYQANIYITNRREKASKTSMGGQQLVTPPEVLWVKITRAVCTFLNTRMNALLTSLKLERWQLGVKDNNTLYYICVNSAILGRFSHFLRLTILSMSHTLDVLLHKIWSIEEDIGSQNLAKRAIKPLLGLSPDKLTDVFRYIRQGLEVDLSKPRGRLNPQEMAILQAVGRHG